MAEVGGWRNFVRILEGLGTIWALQNVSVFSICVRSLLQVEV